MTAVDQRERRREVTRKLEEGKGLDVYLEQFKQQSLVLLFPSLPAGHATGESIEAFTSLFGGRLCTPPVGIRGG